MQAFALHPDRLVLDQIEGLLVAQDVPRPAGEKGYAFRKGHRLTIDDVAVLRSLTTVLHVVRPGADDLVENEAGRRLASAVAGAGTTITGPAQSRYNLVASWRGVVRVNASALMAVNTIEGMAVFTLYDWQPVDAGEVVAGAKIAPLVIDRAHVEAVEHEAAAWSGALVRVVGFEPRRVATLYREKLAPAALSRFEESVRRKVAWFGSSATDIVRVPDDPVAIAARLRSFVDSGAGLILAAGGSSIDPIDPTVVALELAGAHLVRRGVPVHPGSMFWLADLDGVPVVSLASCSLFSQATIVDLVLPRLLVGESVTSADLASFGHGGLMERGMDWRFPPYARERPAPSVAGA